MFTTIFFKFYQQVDFHKSINYRNLLKRNGKSAAEKSFFSHEKIFSKIKISSELYWIMWEILFNLFESLDSSSSSATLIDILILFSNEIVIVNWACKLITHKGKEWKRKSFFFLIIPNVEWYVNENCWQKVVSCMKWK